MTLSAINADRVCCAWGNPHVGANHAGEFIRPHVVVANHVGEFIRCYSPSVAANHVGEFIRCYSPHVVAANHASEFIRHCL